MEIYQKLIFVCGFEGIRNMKKIILASISSRRREILKRFGIEFDIISPSYDEKIQNKSFSYELVEFTALNKGDSVAKICDKDSVIISADTVVVYDNIILGKPKDYDDALRMLKMLSGKTHSVVTSVCVIDNETENKIIKSETSKVTFNDLTLDMIKDYIIEFKPYDKAGAYGIQELSEDFVKEIIGDYDNIVGLPSTLLKSVLKEIGYNIPIQILL